MATVAWRVNSHLQEFPVAALQEDHDVLLAVYVVRGGDGRQQGGGGCLGQLEGWP